MRRLSWPAWGALVGLLAWSAPAYATVVPARTLDRMVLDAARIVRGKVSKKRTIWGKGQRYIYTEITLQVTGTLKGVKSKTLVVHVLGGQIGKRIMRVAGTSTFRIGEEVVVFLEPKRHPTFQFVLGMTSGKYQVFQKKGVVYLQRSLRGLTLQKSVDVAKGHAIHAGHHSEPALRWSALQQRVKAMAKLRSLKNLRVIQPKPHMNRQKYMFLLRLRSIKAHRKMLRQLRPKVGTLLPLSPRAHIGALPQRSLPKKVVPPAVRTTKGGK